MARIGDTYTQAGQYDDADQLYAYICEQWAHAEGALWAKVGQARLHIVRGNDGAAEAAFQEIMRDYTSHARLSEAVFKVGEGYYEQAQLEWKQGFQDKAIPHYAAALGKLELIIERFPETPHNTPLALHFAGICLRRLGRPEAAIDYYQKVCGNWPNYKYAWHAQFETSACYQALAESGALSAFEANARIEQAYMAVVKRYPDCPVARYASQILRQLACRRSRLQKAAAQVAPLLDRRTIDARWADPLYNLGHLCEGAGEFDGAAKAYRGFIQVADSRDVRLENARTKLVELGGAGK